MSIRAERIKLLIEQSGKSYQELEKITGIKKSSLQRYASGATAKIPLNVIEQLSKTFNVSQEYLMGWTEESKKSKNTPDQIKLTEGEQALLELFRLIPEQNQAMVLEMIRAAVNTQL
jgi:transcriptional regulator with XRE-family HTH domain